MKIKIVKTTVCGGVTVKAGKTVEATDEDAKELLRVGKAVAIGGKAKDAETGAEAA